LAEAHEQEPRLQEKQEQFFIHMLRGVVGDETFFEIVESYTELRLGSGEPVPTGRFQEIAEETHREPLEWFFSQWLEAGVLPRLRLEKIAIAKNGDGWLIRGNLRQLSDLVFQLPVELEITTKGGKRVEGVWVDGRKAPFEFKMPDRPMRITADPGFDLLKIQKMPPVLSEIWSGYPANLLVVFGTLSEGQANKAAAERFNKEFLGLGDEVVRADVDVSEQDLNTQNLVLFGRPETNIIAQRFREDFPVRFDGSRFTYSGVTYDEPTQGVAQVIEKPWDPQGLIIMYAGLSGEATRRVCDKSEWREELGGSFLIDLSASYVIFDQHKRLASGDWVGFDGDLVWVSGESSEEG
jgi:hypothetical protein